MAMFRICKLLSVIFLFGGGNCQAQVFFDDGPQQPSRPSSQRGQGGFGVQLGFGQQPQQGFNGNQNPNNNNGFDNNPNNNNGFGNQNSQNPQQGFGSSNNNNQGGFGKNPNQGFGNNNNQNQNQFEQLRSTEEPQATGRQPDCRTYQNSGGFCTPLTSCERIGRMLRNRPPGAAARILSRSICGFNGFLPNVCCPLQRNQFQDNFLENGNGNGGGFGNGNGSGGNNSNNGGFGSSNGGNNGGFGNGGNNGGFGSGGNNGGFGNNGGNNGGFGSGNGGNNGGFGNGGNNGNGGGFGSGSGGGFGNGNLSPTPAPFSTTLPPRLETLKPTLPPVLITSSPSNPFGSGGPVTLIPPKPTTSSSGGLIIIGGGTNPPPRGGGSSTPGLSADGLSDDCGFSNASHTRIVGGRAAEKGGWPWIAALGYKDDAGNVNYLCGGALISSTFVVTASHCVYKRKDLFSVRLGDHDIFTDSDGVIPLNIEVAEIIEHPKYDSGTFYNDIALIRLKQPVPFTRQVHPICLPNTPALRNERFQSNTPFVAGWGAIQFNGPSSSVLQEVQIPVVDDSICQEKFKSFKSVNVDDTNICAGLQAGGKDACQGDSGGPLMQPVGANKYVLIGVVSFGFKCAEPGFPGVYSRVTSHLDWIEKTIRSLILSDIRIPGMLNR